MNKNELIHDKISVPDSAPRTSRLRLLNLVLTSMTTHNATVIHGRAGTGKTTLAADFARRAPRPTCWLKVDAGDSTLGAFCRYLTTTLKSHCPSLDERHMLQIAESGSRDHAGLLAEALVFQLTDLRTDPLLLVIEDLHLVYDAEWVVPFFQRLLPLLPSEVHVIITCRSLPPAPLWRMRSKQMLRVIEESELAFNFDETLQLFKTYGLNEDHARAALRETNGRAAAISNFAATPGRAGRAVADTFLSLEPRHVRGLGHITPDFQT
ncbi:MAG TPA: AAA family ATPase [Pyrinomonadaceae bacterium]|jgi:LuxR family transcriptional regulator, maltose regulon positive regulatory protein|nr:AAA family ATPase [Pyrinomonadaceae bacterium]